MPLEVTPLYAPTAQVLQLNEQTAELELVLRFAQYSFTRRVRWKTVLNFYADARFETMPQQLLRLEEFVISQDSWNQSDVEALEELFDASRGSAYPFLFVTPDDGETHEVRFKDDSLEYALPTAEIRTGQLVLVEAGDLDNSINNGLVYPTYVESTTTTSSTTTTTTETSTTSMTLPAEETE